MSIRIGMNIRLGIGIHMNFWYRYLVSVSVWIYDISIGMYL